MRRATGIAISVIALVVGTLLGEGLSYRGAESIAVGLTTQCFGRLPRCDLGMPAATQKLRDHSEPYRLLSEHYLTACAERTLEVKKAKRRSRTKFEVFLLCRGSGKVVSHRAQIQYSIVMNGPLGELRMFPRTKVSWTPCDTLCRYPERYYVDGVG